MLTQIAQLTQPAVGDALSEAEQQEAAGRLLYVALNNPTVFRGTNEIDLGKFKAAIVTVPTSASGLPNPTLTVKFIRK